MPSHLGRKMLFLMGKDVVLSVSYRVDTQFCYSFSTSTEYWKASNPFLTTIGLLVAQSSLNVGWSAALHIELLRRTRWL